MYNMKKHRREGGKYIQEKMESIIYKQSIFKKPIEIGRAILLCCVHF